MQFLVILILSIIHCISAQLQDIEYSNHGICDPKYERYGNENPSFEVLTLTCRVGCAVEFEGRLSNYGKNMEKFPDQGECRNGKCICVNVDPKKRVIVAHQEPQNLNKNPKKLVKKILHEGSICDATIATDLGDLNARNSVCNVACGFMYIDSKGQCGGKKCICSEVDLSKQLKFEEKIEEVTDHEAEKKYLEDLLKENALTPVDNTDTQDEPDQPLTAADMIA